MPTDFFDFSFNTLVAVGGIIFAVAYAWEKFRAGGGKAQEEYTQSREDLVTRLNEQLDAQRQINDSIKEQLKEAVAQIHQMTLEFGEMKGQLKTYEAILQNRNPELEKTLVNLNSMAVMVPTFIAEVRTALKIKTGKYTKALTESNAKA